MCGSKERTVEMTSEIKNKAIGISKGVRWIRICFLMTILVIQAVAITIVIIKVAHSLLNSKSSEVSLVKVRGIKKKSK